MYVEYQIARKQGRGGCGVASGSCAMAGRQGGGNPVLVTCWVRARQEAEEKKEAAEQRVQAW